MKDYMARLGASLALMAYPPNEEEEKQENLSELEIFKRTVGYLSMQDPNKLDELLAEINTGFVKGKKIPAQSIAIMNSEITKYKAYSQHVQKVLRVASQGTGNVPYHGKPVPMVEVKRSVQQAVAYNMEHDTMLRAYDKIVPALWKEAVWFDFREVATEDPHMSEFGRELLVSGTVELPFKNCVFVFSFLGKDDEVVTAPMLLQQHKAKVIIPICSCLIPQSGMPFIVWDTGLNKEDLVKGNPNLKEAILDVVGFAIAALSARGVRKEQRMFSGDKDLASYPPEKAARLQKDPHQLYTKFVIDYSKVRGYGGGVETGERGRQRLHWRRGHVRHYSNKEDSKRSYSMTSTWVRAALIGVGSDTVIVHDYEYHGPKKD